MGVTEWCWTEYPEPQRSGWLEACGWITCIDPLPSAAGRPPSTVPSAGPEYRLEVLCAAAMCDVFGVEPGELFARTRG